MKRVYSPYIAGITVLLVTVIVTLMVEKNQSREFERQSRNEALTYLSAVRARLEGTFNSTIYLTRALTVLVTAQDGISRSKFNQIARELMSSSHHIRNVALAEGYVINYMYPISGNQKAIGLDYRKLPAQWDAVKRAIDTGQTVIAGPVKLVQGGEAFINRTPIFKSAFSDKPDSGEYWGIASIVINMDTVFEEAGLPDTDSKYRVAIRGKDGLGEKGAVFWGDGNLFEQNPERLEVTFPNGQWQLATIPTEGWISSRSNSNWILISGIIIGILLAALTIIVQRNSMRLQHYALHDPLTKLPNRLLFNDRVSQALAQAQRSRGQIALAVLDLNKFKPVNDTYGHLAGDYVLEQVAYRIRATLRKVDIVARTGGDEFTLLFVNIKSLDNIAVVVDKLTARLLDPFIWHGQQISVGVSIGIAIYPEHGQDLTELFHNADSAMYEAKHDPNTNWKIMTTEKSKLSSVTQTADIS
ncbi:diguanylate cyclase domain-containing protein [Sedimenticola selenatireducens]|uniref:Sensor domain-containing diguanylate cyclase n=1 Tax=Sedimenticola selenatireducens TaxID=191960 RepID=A0A557S821_9GAMM|nr:diguanylate cyclase [Sedimenticola selenatireducens]TVO73545.1 sensor domain-containing diguanylate cyclase [Sedimenticola selenatireducens]TVT63486.1 MAG: sensor domain-containing diguanylate cyclase [Sedimenticola selenatireducens]